MRWRLLILVYVLFDLLAEMGLVADNAGIVRYESSS